MTWVSHAHQQNDALWHRVVYERSNTGGEIRNEYGMRNFVAGSRWRAIREFVYGVYGYEFERQSLEMRGELESAFMMITLGDMLGLPIIPPIYSLRVLPYLVPNIAAWKRRVLRERDLADKEEFHLHRV